MIVIFSIHINPGGHILAIYIYSISFIFTSENKQSIEIRVVNLIGEIIFTENLEDFEGEYKRIQISEQNVYLKMYGKKISKPLRKLGHMNLVARENESIKDLLQKLASLKNKVKTIALN